MDPHWLKTIKNDKQNTIQTQSYGSIHIISR